MKSIAATLLLLIIPSSLLAEDGGMMYRFFKEARPLELKPGAYAVFHEPDAAIGQELAIGASHTPTALPGVTRIEMLGDGKPMRETLADLGRDLRAIGFVSPVFRDTLGGDLIPTDTILVAFKESVPEAEASAILNTEFAGGVVRKPWPGIGRIYAVRTSLPDGLAVLEKANRLAMRDDVAFAEPDMVFSGSGSFIPNDPEFPNCWGHRNVGQFGGVPDMDMDTDLAWDLTTGSAEIAVVVIDTGVDLAHPDLTLHPMGFDTTSEAGSGQPINEFDNHGTPVAGCVSASINNGIGTVGVAPNCPVVPVRAFISINSSGSWNAQGSWTVSALNAAVLTGARVTNNSNRYGFTSGAIASAYATTRLNGIVHFSSAGNESASTAAYPSSLTSVNAISAIGEDGLPTSFTNSFIDMAFAAPGIDVRTTDRSGSDGWSSGDYTYAYGTSFASPYAAGVAALVLSQDPTLDAFDVEQILRQSATDLGAPGQDSAYGHGLVNAYRAVSAATVCPGDCGPNGVVEFSDLVTMLFRFGSPNQPAECDVTGDGEINFADLVAALFLFGPCPNG